MATLRALRRLKRDQEPPSPFVFTSERGSPFTTAGWRKMVARLGVAAKLGFKAHPHMFRHACGFQLANQGTDTRTLQVLDAAWSLVRYSRARIGCEVFRALCASSSSST
jgi:site-specific recombinase XerD